MKITDKRSRYTRELEGILDRLRESSGKHELVGYLVSHSNLPGPRGNLELAHAFADTVTLSSEGECDRLWALCQDLISISATEAPVNHPQEFLPFCGALGIGAIGSMSETHFLEAVGILRHLAGDQRWRMREGVAMGLQRLLEAKPEEVMTLLDDWIEESRWLQMRAVVAGVAEPSLLKNEKTAAAALRLHKQILWLILRSENHRSAEFRILRKGLAYTLSVVVQAIPKAGFDYVRELIRSGDPDVLWIVRQNLRKKRLARNFPDEVSTMMEVLS